MAYISGPASTQVSVLPKVGVQESRVLIAATRNPPHLKLKLEELTWNCATVQFICSPSPHHLHCHTGASQT